MSTVGGAPGYPQQPWVTPPPSHSKPGRPGPARLFQELWKPDRAATRPLPLPAVVALTAIGTLSALAIWFFVFALALSGVQERRDNTVLYAKFREQVASETAPLGGVIKPGAPVALIQAPGSGLPTMIVVEGTAPGELTAGPGHRRDTPLPGQAGVSVIYGRSTTFGAPFGNLPKLKAKQLIRVTTGQGVFTYLVDDVRRPGDPVPVALAAGGSRLLLETSAGPVFGSRQTVYVDATLQGNSVVAPAGRPNAVADTEQAMHGDTRVLLPLVLWLEALIAVVLLALWLRVRWGWWPAWAVGLPMLIAILWAISDRAVLLLPNLV